MGSRSILMNWATPITWRSLRRNFDVSVLDCATLIASRVLFSRFSYQRRNGRLHSGARELKVNCPQLEQVTYDF